MGENKRNHTFENLLGAGYSVNRERVIRHIGKNLITRGSSYGAEMLCSVTMPIIDLDYTEYFSGYSAIKRAKGLCEELIAEQLECFGRKINTNLYRTKKGLRLIISGQYEWNLEDAIDVMGHIDADPIYTMLCAQQNCYRARLTPKPARIGLRSVRSFQLNKEGLGGEFARGEEVVKRDLDAYYLAARGYRTCILIQRLGGHKELDEFQELLRIHDKKTGVHLHGYPLA
jgi:hypothetical protein